MAPNAAKSHLALLLADIIRELALPKKTFAKEVGLSNSALSHLLSGDTTYNLSVTGCLRIAAAYRQVNPSDLLRAAGKREAADLIERLYGPAAERHTRFAGGRRLTGHVDRAVTRLLAIDPGAQKLVYQLVDMIYDSEHNGGSSAATASHGPRRHHARVAR